MTTVVVTGGTGHLGGDVGCPNPRNAVCMSKCTRSGL
jgi:hypothetical protein